MSKSSSQNLRIKYLELISAALTSNGEEVLRTNSNEIAIPVVDEEGEETYLVFTLKVPSGARDGEPYDGYAMADDYKLKCKLKEEKAKAAAAKKQAKIERDKVRREKIKEQKERRGN